MVLEECGVLQSELSDFHGNMEEMGYDGREPRIVQACRDRSIRNCVFNPGAISDPESDPGRDI